MPEDLGDFRDRRAMTDHPGGQAVPKKVSHTAMLWAYTGASEGEPYNVVDRTRPRQSDAWRDQPQKDLLGDTCSAVLTEVKRDGFADIGEELHMIQPRTLAAYDDLARAPMNIAEFERHDFPCPQTEPREQEKDCVVAPSSSGGSVCGG
jgi:hypothetical protein